jgi:hypothetical protein
LRNARGRRTGRSSDRSVERPGGYDYYRCLDAGPGPGERDEFFNDLLFRYRKAGKTRDVVSEAAYERWTMMEQDPNDPWPWEWVEYKIDRVWLTVAPDEVTKHDMRWARASDRVKILNDVEAPTVTRLGYARIVANPRRKQL